MRHAGLEPRTSGPQAALLLTRLSLALDRSRQPTPEWGGGLRRCRLGTASAPPGHRLRTSHGSGHLRTSQGGSQGGHRRASRSGRPPRGWVPRACCRTCHGPCCGTGRRRAGRRRAGQRRSSHPSRRPQCRPWPRHSGPHIRGKITFSSKTAPVLIHISDILVNMVSICDDM